MEQRAVHGECLIRKVFLSATAQPFYTEEHGGTDFSHVAPE